MMTPSTPVLAALAIVLAIGFTAVLTMACVQSRRLRGRHRRRV